MAPVKANPPAYKNGLPLSSNSIKPDISNLTKHDGANSQTQKLLDEESNDHIPVNGEKVLPRLYIFIVFNIYNVPSVLKIPLFS